MFIVVNNGHYVDVLLEQRALTGLLEFKEVVTESIEDCTFLPLFSSLHTLNTA